MVLTTHAVLRSVCSWVEIERFMEVSAIPKGQRENRTGKEGGRCSLVVEVNRRTMITGERLISQRGGVEGKLKVE